MTFQPNFPPSLLARVTEETAEGTKKRSKEDYRKMKELEEARKSAAVPAMKDEEGRDINPHIPQYIMQAPWYYGNLKPTLNHQRVEQEKDTKTHLFDKWYKRGVREDLPKSSGYRKGACENCGSMTHKKRDCFERPRKLGAALTGDDIAPDEFLQPDLDLGFEGKRDRWNGYDPNEHKRLVDEFQRLEEARKVVRAKQLEESMSEEVPKEILEQDEDKYGDDVAMPGQKFDSKQRQSIRNLRIREDTAKYLYNLDPNSAYYDPKTRSMRENPFGDKAADEVPYAGDNVDRFAGDAMRMMKNQVFAWDMHDESGLDVHLQADPTRLELLSKKVTEAKTEVQTCIKDDILDKYGGREHLEAPPKELLLAQSETYVEYSRTGRVIKGNEKPKVMSRYEEDVFLNNHTSVWGSYWYNGRWGFKCCHSTIKESYCTGDKGKAMSTDGAALPHSDPPRLAIQPPPGLEASTSMPPPSTSGLPFSASMPPLSPSELPSTTSMPPPPPYQPPPSSSESSATKRKLDETTPTSLPSSNETNVAPKKKRKEKKQESPSSESSSSSSSESSSESSSSEEEEERKSKSKKKRRSKKTQKKELVVRKLSEKKRLKKKENKKKRKRAGTKKKESDSDDSDKELMKAIAKEKARQADVSRLMQLDERIRPYNSTYEVKEPSKYELEAYHRTKMHPDDPMNKFTSS